MSDMQIFIPTRGRVNNQGTWDFLPDDIRQFTNLVCPDEEVELHRAKGRNAIGRGDVKGIGNARQFILDKLAKHEHVIMLDDDLNFFVRADPNAFNLKRCDNCETSVLIRRIHALLEEGWVHAGLSPRQMNNQHFPAIFRDVMRMNAVHAVNRDVLARHGIRYNELEIQEEYNVTLQLFKLGIPNRVIVDGCWDQTGASGASGGCSLFRTAEVQDRGSKALAALHPDVVKVVTKTPKSIKPGEMWSERTDVRVQWRKAYTGPKTECM